jgi:plastocyanin
VPLIKEDAMSRAWWLLPLVIASACSKTPTEKPADKPAPAAPAPAAPAVAVVADGKQVVELTVTEKGFEPTPVKVKAGQPVELKITRKTDKTCATDIVMKDPPINQKLPLDETVTVSFTPSTSGELKYGCAMDQMVAGVLMVE